MTSAPVVQVLVCGASEDGFRGTSAALEGAALATPSVRDAVQELLGRDPGHGAAAALLDPFAPPAARSVAPCEAPLARLVSAGPGAAADAASAFFRLAGERGEIVLLRFVVPERPRGAALRTLEAVARLAAGRLEAETFRREIAGRNAAYRTFQEAAGEAIFVVDPATGRVLEGNQKLCETTGYGRHELRRLTLSRLLEHPVLDAAALLAKLASERVFRDDEIRLRRRRGQPLPVAVTTARIELPERTVLHVIARDVTRERRALADLRQARDTLAALHLAGAHLTRETDEEGIYAIIARELGRLGFHCGVLARDPEGDAFRWRFTSFHPPLQRALGRVLGRPLPQLRLDAATPLLRRCLESGRTVHTDRPRGAAEELLGLRTAAQLRGLVRLVAIRRVILAPLRRDARIDAVLVVASARARRGDPEAIDAFALQASIALDKARLFAALQDERARLESEVERRTRELRRAVEALEETDRRKDNFLANISHELRTPLVTVLGYADLVLSEKLGPLAERQRAALSVVSTSARRLRSFIEELLDFSRHELTGGKLACAELEVADVMTQAVLALAPRFAERGLRVRARAARGTPRAWGDRERVVQVLVNLLANAERYSPDGSVIRLAAARVGERIEIAVADRGAGIPDEHLAHIFDRLYQVRDASSPKHKGGALGLGLAIVKSIVEAHGGTVTVRSRVGRGTTFRFSLPSAPLAGPAVAGPGGDAQGGRRAFASPPISRRSAAE